MVDGFIRPCVRNWRHHREAVERTMTILDAAKSIQDYCNSFGDKCRGCVFNNGECIFYADLPCDWVIPTIAPITDEIQHVGYDAAQLGREK